jgi:hypothetical protein
MNSKRMETASFVRPVRRIVEHSCSRNYRYKLLPERGVSDTVLDVII